MSFVITVGILHKSALATLSSDSYDGVEKGVYTHPQLTPKKLGYKLVGDNIDKTVKSRHMRLNDHHNKSFHYFYSFSVQNRIDISIVQQGMYFQFLKFPLQPRRASKQVRFGIKMLAYLHQYFSIPALPEHFLELTQTTCHEVMQYDITRMLKNYFRLLSIHEGAGFVLVQLYT